MTKLASNPRDEGIIFGRSVVKCPTSIRDIFDE